MDSADFNSKNIGNLIDKMQSFDKDLRFMALNDITVFLRGPHACQLQLDDGNRSRIISKVFLLLEDKHSDVQNLAVQCLVSLTSLNNLAAKEIVEGLTVNLSSASERLREIYCIGLRAVITELPPNDNYLCIKICNDVLRCFDKCHDSIDILSDLLSHFGPTLASMHKSIATVLLSSLSERGKTVRICVALSRLSYVVSDELHYFVLNSLIEELQNPNLLTPKVAMLALAAIARPLSADRFKSSMPRVAPILLKYLYLDDEELLEASLHALTALATLLQDHWFELVGRCIVLCKYDPNYITYDDDNNDSSTTIGACYDLSSSGEEEISDNDGGGDGDEEEEDADEDDEDDDEDDLSWKLRRGSLRCISSMLHVIPDSCINYLSPILISRILAEREEAVRTDVLNSVNTLISFLPINALNDLSQNLVSSLCHFVKKPAKSHIGDSNRQLALSILNRLVELLPTFPNVAIAVSAVSTCLSMSHRDTATFNNNANLKVDAVIFARKIISRSSFTSAAAPAPTALPIKELTKIATVAIRDPFYRIASEGLQLAQILARFANSNVHQELFDICLARLQQSDADTEVKRKAILCVAEFIADYSSVISAEKENIVYDILIERLLAEGTRLAAIRSTALVVRRPSFQSRIPETLPVLFASLHQQHIRNLRYAALQTLETIVTSCKPEVALCDPLLQELPSLITDSDVNLASLALRVGCALLSLHGDTLSVASLLMPSVLKFMQTPLLQEINSVVEFFITLCKLGSVSSVELIEKLTANCCNIDSGSNAGVGSPTADDQYLFNVARTCTALILQCTDKPNELINSFINILSDRTANDVARELSLLTIGEVGRNTDLKCFIHKHDFENLRTLLIECLNDKNEDIKKTASFALGRVGIGGCLQEFLTRLLTDISQAPVHQQYLLLRSLRELISCADKEKLSPLLSALWEMLLSFSERSEEEILNIVAECLGILAVNQPKEMLPILQECLHSDIATRRIIAVSAFKFVFSEMSVSNETLLNHFRDFVEVLNDSELNVRREAFLTLNCLIHHRPELIRDSFLSIIKAVFKETAVRKELVHEVEMGPFKHTVDDGLDVRKSAFECLQAILNNGILFCYMDPYLREFFDCIENGIKDQYEVKILNFSILRRASQIKPDLVLQHLEKFAPLYKSILFAVSKPNSLKQDQDKQEELRRCVLNVISNLQRSPHSGKYNSLTSLLNAISSNPNLSAELENLKSERLSSTAFTPMNNSSSDDIMDVN